MIGGGQKASESPIARERTTFSRRTVEAFAASPALQPQSPVAGPPPGETLASILFLALGILCRIRWRL
jgi:hypothetical protein